MTSSPPYIDLAVPNSTFVLDRDGDHNRLQVQIIETAGSWSVAVVRLEWSVDGTYWNSFQPNVVFNSANSSRVNIDVTGVRHIRLRVSEADTGAAISAEVNYRFFSERTSRGMINPTSELYLDIGQGHVPGFEIVQKFGYSSVGTSLQPITNSGNYPTPTSPTTLELVSSDSNDSSSGTGAQQVTVVGLGSDWTEVSQTVEMNGTSAVTVGTDFYRVYRWWVSRSGTYADSSNGSHAGTLTLREQGGGSTWFTITTSLFPLGQSVIGAYTIPKGKTGHVVGGNVFADTSKSVDAILFRRDNADDVSTPYLGVMRAAKVFVGLSGSQPLNLPTPLGPFVGPCDIGFMAEVSSGTADVSVDFDIVLVDT